MRAGKAGEVGRGWGHEVGRRRRARAGKECRRRRRQKLESDSARDRRLPAATHTTHAGVVLGVNRHAAVVVVVFFFAWEENDTPPPFPLRSARNPPISRFLPMGNAKIATAAWGAATAESAGASVGLGGEPSEDRFNAQSRLRGLRGRREEEERAWGRCGLGIE